MSTVIIQLRPDGYVWAVVPKNLDDPPENVERVWPREPHPVTCWGRRLPQGLADRVRLYDALRTLLDEADADEVLLAIEPSVEERRIGIVEVALDHADVGVELVTPHRDGALGIARDYVSDFISSLDPPNEADRTPPSGER
ncbi:hypothetical protein [Lutibaculum baratangense]|uniref:Uncharacterized protein n=1 Tax=Lutibaculum baratangense AMV1 TaxID=631454 RepID=V4QS11_9HYPH|nr:hypothetical protein [Lutibaculum baratangense]ESR22547.1 hypothetical protein N177_4112 [Lutibaculum baratangense AMV1]